MKEERGKQKGERKRYWERWEDSGRESDRKRRGMVGRERGVKGRPGSGRGLETISNVHLSSLVADRNGHRDLWPDSMWKESLN